MATSGLYGSTVSTAVVLPTGTETSGLYGNTASSIVALPSGSESTGLYGSNTVFGGTYFQWLIFQESATAPTTPTGGSWDFTTNTGTPPTGWLNSPPVSPTHTIWFSLSIVNSKTPTELVWSVPGPITGPQGIQGVPGTPGSVWYEGSGAPSAGTGINGDYYLNVVNGDVYTKSGTWSVVGNIKGPAGGGSGSGDVVGPSGATDNAIARFDTATGKLIQNSVITITDTGTASGLEAISFNTSPANIPTTPGSLYWDNSDGNQTLSLVMASGTATQQIGEESYFRIKASAAITNGQVVMFSGTVGASGGLKGAPATGLTASTASYVMGIATQDIPLNGWGYVTNFGLVRGINTTGGAESWVDGQILYYDPTVAGGLTKTVPSAPNAKVQVCAVVYAASNGSLFVRPAFGGELGQYEGDTQITSPAAYDLLQRDSSNTKWQNIAPSAITVGNVSGTVAIANGGTGNTTRQAAIDALAGSVTSGAYLRGDGSHVSMSSIPTGDIPWGTPGDIGATTQASGKFTAAYGSAAITYPTQFTTKTYVDNVASTGIHIHNPVVAETQSALTATYAQGGTTPTITAISTNNTLTSVAHGLSVNDMIVFNSTTNGLTAGVAYFVYAATTDTFQITATFGGDEINTLTNGSGLSITSRANSGVGATLTNAGTQTALVIDGVTLSVGNRVLVTAQVSGAQNGVYTVTNVGSGSTNWVLTRSTDTNKYNPFSDTGLGTGDYFLVTGGTVAAGESYVFTTTGAVIIGTTVQTFTLFNAVPTYVGGTNITVTGHTIDLTGQVAVANGGTGASTASAALTNLGAAALAGATYTGPVVLAAGTNSVAPLDFQTGTNLTTASAGAMEYDGQVHYSTHAAGERGAIPSTQFITLTSAYTGVSGTALQKLFNAPTNGAVTLAAGTYFFECAFSLTGLSATSGTFSFGFGGTAVVTRVKYFAQANKGAVTPVASLLTVGSATTATALVAATTTTTGQATIQGKIVIGTGGTLIPSFAVSVTTTPVVGVDSYFNIWAAGSTSVQSVGNWS